MEIKTFNHWNEKAWRQAETIYNRSFPQHGRKKEDIIKRMFQRQTCYLHLAYIESEVVAMALTGKTENEDYLIIDYIAVNLEVRKQGIGKSFIASIKKWAKIEQHYEKIIIEVEAERTVNNVKRIVFWESCGFKLTDYVHDYIWVPESYQAMYCNLDTATNPEDNGEILFRYITDFHKMAYRK